MKGKQSIKEENDRSLTAHVASFMIILMEHTQVSMSPSK